MKGTLKPPTIPEQEKSAFVEHLLAIIEQQASILRQQAEKIQQLSDEIARLKNQPPRPKIKPSSLGKKDKGKSKKSKGKRPGSKKRNKTAKLEIHETRPIEPDYIPKGSEFKCYKDFVVQDIVIKPHNTRFRLKVYQTPDGGYVTGTLPPEFNEKHYGPTVIRFILYQYYHCHVTQPLLLEQLGEIGIDISAGQLNNLLIAEKDRFHQEKDRILAAGLEVSKYINVDDTGARHQGKNGYCTYIGNEWFSWFESTGSKSRINFLKLLRAGYLDFAINMDAICYIQSNKLPQKELKAFTGNLGMIFANDSQWNDFLAKNGIVKDRHVKIATEGVLIGSIIEHGISKDLVILSDDAGQFNVLLHALCWIHANRAIDKIIAFTDQAKEDLDNVKDQIWHLYEGLKEYKQDSNESVKNRLNEMFDEIFTQKTASATLNNALNRIYRNKSELLMVLQRPDIPLHNNSAENGIREYVKKRKISGSTRSESGRKCRDTFTSLKKTCRKLKISFWEYLKDRIENSGLVPDLSDLIRKQALHPI
jgi:hypothetical protein